MTTCNHGYYMKSGSDHAFDMKILYDETQMAYELGLQLLKNFVTAISDFQAIRNPIFVLVACIFCLVDVNKLLVFEFPTVA